MTDLFTKPPTKEQMLEEFCQRKGYIATHQIIRWGADNFYNRADRTKRDLVEKGRLRRMDTHEKVMRNFDCKDDVYEYVGVG